MIYVLLADGFEEIEALSFVDILRRAEINIETVSVNDSKTVVGAHDISVNADKLLNEIDTMADGVVLPGGIPGTPNLQKNSTVTAILSNYFKNGKLIGAICAAPSILGELSLLDSKKATCYPSFESKLHGAVVSEERVVTDGNIITSRGAGTAHDFAFKFVEILKGKETADNIRSSMLYDI